MPAEPKTAARRLACAVLAALVALGVAAPLAHAASGADARFEGNSAIGDAVFFSTKDELVDGDTDSQADLYVREFDAGLGKLVTQEVSLGPTGGNDAFPVQYLATDEAGSLVFFSTEERLTEDDQDGATDIYVRDVAANETSLVSVCTAGTCSSSVQAGPAPGGVVDEGNDVFFLSGGDLYVRDVAEGETTLVSVADSSCGGCGNGSKLATFLGASADGTRAIFKTPEALVGEDDDSESDVYERNLESEETALVSTPEPGAGGCPASVNCEPANSTISGDGSHVFFETKEQIVASDVDSSQDVYDWSDGTAVLASIGAVNGNGSGNARYAGSSANGDRVFFVTVESLLPADSDSTEDVYARTAGATTELVSEGESACAPADCRNAEFEWVAASGSPVVFRTVEQLTSADQDAASDVYSRALPAGATTLVSRPGSSCGDPDCGKGEASFAGASLDGTHVFFVTDEALAPPAGGNPFGDRDEATDVYDRSGGETILVSAGQLTGEGPYTGNEDFQAQLQGISEDGSRAFFVTHEQLTESDGDAGEDVYQRSSSGTLLVSRDNGASVEEELAPEPPSLVETDPESPASATTLRVIGTAQPGALIKLYETPDCSGEPLATGTAEQLEDPGIAVTVGVGSSTDFYATAEAGGFPSKCSSSISYRQQSSQSGGSGGGGGSDVPPVGKRPVVGVVAPVEAIQYLEPVTRITYGPASKTRVRRPVFRFTDATGQAGTRFLCKLDRRGWKWCGSPFRLRKLSLGGHVFRVKGVNAAGAKESRASTRRFKLVRR